MQIINIFPKTKHINNYESYAEDRENTGAINAITALFYDSIPPTPISQGLGWGDAITLQEKNIYRRRHFTIKLENIMICSYVWRKKNPQGTSWESILSRK